MPLGVGDGYVQGDWENGYIIYQCLVQGTPIFHRCILKPRHFSPELGGLRLYFGWEGVRTCKTRAETSASE